MTLLPVVERELRVACRRGWTYWGRCSVSLIAVLLMAWLAVALGGNQNSNHLARISFTTLASFCFAFTLLAGMLFSADSFARELREGTLGLLFLTDLRSLDIVLGKLAATSLGSVYCLVSVFPILAIPLLLGGITGGEYLRVVGALLVTLWSALTLGLLASTLGRSGRFAGFLALALMAAVCVAGPLAGALWWRAAGRPAAETDLVVEGLSRATPFRALLSAFEFGSFNFPGYSWSMGFVFLTGVVALIWAAIRLPGLGLGAGDTERTRQRRPMVARPDGSGDGQSHPISPGLAPIQWLSARSSFRSSAPWIFLAISAVGWLVIRGLAGHEWNTVPGWITTSLWVHFGLKSWLAVESAFFYHQERRSGGIELLLTTGLADADFIDGAVQSLRRAYAWPLALVTAIELAVVLFDLDAGLSTDDKSLLAVFWLGRLAMLWLDAEALTWTGTWIGVSTRGQRAGAANWVLILLLPYLIWIAGMMIFGLIEILGLTWFHRISPSGSNARMTVLILLGLALNFAVSGYWWTRSARSLRREFRARAQLPLGKVARG